ncbi:MAG: hypothetical protein A2942_02630 [Candidatus Lloydbacteria bacterium RIFCSPLOWO2_01_FULL_50_20]|uniref:tRNA/rRNA methyltransferase SpoU type domain-containing protein n=1 Tax=Candidatus Lloydbacteria bacterium RIFCSPLOWO2_01_FULL_50_20 TaxID=1798665 RepID=A0A1G2DE57_9BACT|nr:MAG: hypothetical protein A3C13_04425 [Candidatus Lloydbacteria bacterium RIFCSPHIGHO2_02_FULL_50_11]OGZ11823.1 MAG: hypothetical protein A2942_02630 [Candidatus Lloydbacteria bacterium RIFCSPLOWO2_01_FULL_50_20]
MEYILFNRIISNGMKKEVSVLLHNIRSAHNVGSIFRTADTLHVSRIYLSGHSPTPVDRFGRPVKDIAKTALGAEKTIPWEYAKTPGKFLRRCKKDGFIILGVEQDKHALDYKSYRPGKKTLVIVGNEIEGIPKDLRKKCDVLVEIPMRGSMVRQAHHPHSTQRGKESLNVSVAFGIALFRLFDQK